MEEIKPLAVYSASAGSGKTFSLVQTYLKLTLGNKEAYQNFNKVMAMTFTNKAAWEMKARIIEALSILSSEALKGSELEKKQADLLTITAKKTGLNSAEVHERAGHLLSTILHNYEGFSISTIDKFSLRLIRTFSKELDINEDFEVIINEDELIETVVDELLSSIGSEGFERVTELALNYAKSNLSEGNKWNFRRSLIEFAKVLKKEEDQPFIKHILETNFESDLYQEIQLELKGLKEQYEKQKQAVLKTFEAAGLSSDDLPFKESGIYGYYTKKLPDSTLKAPAAVGKRGEDALNGSSLKEQHVFPASLVSATLHFLELEEQLVKRYYIVDKMRSNFHNLALLKNIAEALEKIKERDNVIRISEFNQMISELLSKEQAPFIYERLGARYQHYLLDEFQDTSRLQWLNLIPLVHDSISQNYDNLIVGDPKQAIYRFRNGLVDQFVALPKIYNPEQDSSLAQISKQFDALGEKHSLKDNWRSQQNIVLFNNTFFEEALKILPDQYRSYYADVVQNPKGKKGGLVKASYHTSNKNDNVDDLEKDFILETVRKAEADGFKRGDICLLSNTKRAAKRWAKYLIKAPERYKVVSADSLFVSADKTVQLFINYLKLRKNPSYATAQIQFAVGYLQLKELDPLVILKEFWKERVGDLDFERFVNHYFGELNAFFYDYENLYDLGQLFSKLVKVKELENPYLHHLMEMLQNYDLKLGPDLRGFLEEWTSNGYKETVQMPENESSIRIMTIHKAKGLEFPVVILPSLAWSFSTVKDLKFLQADDGALIQTRLVKKNAPDFVLDAYNNEVEKQLLDYFNLLYVAFTRPVNRLYMLINLYTGKNDDLSNINAIAAKVLKNYPQQEGVHNSDATFVKGSESQASKQEIIKQNEFIPKDISDFIWFPDMTLQDEETLTDEKENLQTERRFGNQMHLLLSKVDKIETLKKTVQDLLRTDQLEYEFKHELTKAAEDVLSIPAYKSLIQGATLILSEQAIITGSTETKKPDKIVINGERVVVLDFKTGTPLNSHKKQVEEYVKTIVAMGHKEVSGYLLYTKQLTLEEVV